MQVGIDVEDIETKRDTNVDVDGLTSLEVGEQTEMYKMDIIDSSSCRAVPIGNDEISPNIHTGAKTRCRQQPSESRGLGVGTPAPMGSALDGMKAFWGAVLDSSTSSALSPTFSSASDGQASDAMTDAACIRNPGAARIKITTGAAEVTRAHDDNDDDDDGGELTSSGEEGSSAGASKRFRRHTIAY